MQARRVGKGVSMTRYRYHWLFSAAVFFFIAVGLGWNLARAYIMGYWGDILTTQYDTAIYFGAVGLALIFVVICVNYASPMDLLNKLARLERERAGVRRILRHYRDNPSSAIELDLAGAALRRMGGRG